MNRNDLNEEALAAGCPHASRLAGIPIREQTDAAVPTTLPPQLHPFSQVVSHMPPDGPLGITAAWMRRYLGRPHPELGRSGPVCPFVPGATAQDTVWLSGVSFGRSDKDAIVQLVGLYRDLFLQLEPRSGELAMMKAIVLVFPNISIEDAGVIDAVQSELKAPFVDSGLMIGEFHERNESPGLRNPDFRPLRSPIPAIAIRFMVETDLPFLNRTMYPPPVRAEFIRSYLRRMGSTISRNNFDAALDGLVTAQIEMRRNEPSLMEVTP
jgi:hypothetical protein